MYENYKGFEDEDDFDGDALAEWFVNSELGKAVKRVTDEAKKKDAIINPVVYTELLMCARRFELLSGVESVAIQPLPAYKSLIVKITANEVIFEKEGIKAFSDLIKCGSSFSVDPALNGRVHLNIGIKNIYIDEKSQS